MKQTRQSEPSNGPKAGIMRRSEPLTKASPEAASMCNVQFISKNCDSIEDLLERYDFQYVFERARQTIASFPDLQHLVEEITCEVYSNFWQRLVKGPVENPSAYIGKMVHNRCIDHLRCLIHEKCHFIQSNDGEALDILESIHLTANSEGLRDPAQEFEMKVATEAGYRRVTAAIAKLSPRQQQAAAWHLLCNADDPQLLLKLFNAFQIALPVLHPGNKEEEHLLDASYNHA